MSQQATTALRYFTVKGRVQQVMFRQTLIRAALKRHLRGGATNSKQDKNEVSFTLQGDNAKIEEIINFMKTGKELNSWGAKVDTVTENSSGKPIEEHKVTTDNVDSFNWKGGVEMYI